MITWSFVPGQNCEFRYSHGISFGLSRDLGIGVKEAEKYIEMYFHVIQGSRNILITHQVAKEKGYVTLCLIAEVLPDCKAGTMLLNVWRTQYKHTDSRCSIIKLAMIKVYVGF